MVVDSFLGACAHEVLLEGLLVPHHKVRGWEHNVDIFNDGLVERVQGGGSDYPGFALAREELPQLLRVPVERGNSESGQGELHAVGSDKQVFEDAYEQLRRPLAQVSDGLGSEWPVLLHQLLDVDRVGVVVSDAAEPAAPPFVQVVLPFDDGVLQ